MLALLTQRDAARVLRLSERTLAAIGEELPETLTATTEVTPGGPTSVEASTQLSNPYWNRQRARSGSSGSVAVQGSRVAVQGWFEESRVAVQLRRRK
jgi:hypothetical protein